MVLIGCSFYSFQQTARAVGQTDFQTEAAFEFFTGALPDFQMLYIAGSHRDDQLPFFAN